MAEVARRSQWKPGAPGPRMGAASPVGDAMNDSPVAKVSLAGLARQVRDELFSLDRGFGWTLATLYRDPGEAIRAYVDRRDARATPPVRYAVLALAITALSMALFRLLGRERAPDTPPTDDALLVLVGRPELVLVLALIPALALALLALFRRERIEPGEAGVVASYAVAQAIMTLAFTALLLAPFQLTTPVYAGAGTATFCTYVIYAIARYFGARWSTWLRAVLASALAIVLAGSLMLASRLLIEAAQ